MIKKTMLAAALIFFGASASAQSSITLYGRIDNGVMYEAGLPKGALFGAESGGYGISWWGLEGSEDLGGGSKAVFKLESGFDGTTGKIYSSSLFGRHATVGLSNASYGTLKLGNIGVGFVAGDSFDIDPQKFQDYATETLVRGRNWAQAGNGAEYTSGNLDGLTLEAQYTLTNTPGDWNGCSGSACGTQPSFLGNAQGRADGFKAMYDRYNMKLMAIYDEVRDENGQFTNVYDASREVILGGNYTWGPLKAYVGYELLRAPQATIANQDVTTGAVTGTLPSGISGAPTTVNHGWVGLSYDVSPFVRFSGAIYHANANNGNGNATLYTLGGNYFLSKRTFLYTELAYVTNSATSNVGLGDGFSDAYGPNANEGGTSEAPDYGKSQFGATVGIMHQF